MSLLKTKRRLFFIIIAVMISICFSIILIIVYGKRNSETPFSLERNRVSSIFLVSHSESRFLTESETDEFVRRFNLFDVYRQNNPKYAVASDLIFIGTPVEYIISFNDETEITIRKFAEGVFNLGGEIEIKSRNTICSVAGVVKNMVAYEEYSGRLF